MKYGRQIALSLTVGALMILNSCATAAPPAVRTQIVTKTVPVPVPCITGELPKEPGKVGKLSGDAEKDIGPIAALATRALAWGRELFAVASACKAD